MRAGKNGVTGGSERGVSLRIAAHSFNFSHNYII